MKWTKTPPISPTEPPSEYYWYSEVEGDLEVIEVWPNRSLNHFKGYWWPAKIEAPPLSLPKKKKGK